MRIIKALLSLVALLVLLVAVPVILLSIGVWRIDWANLLTRPDDGSVLLSLITAIAWSAWCVFAVSVLAEVVTIVRDSPLAFRLPGFSWLARLLIGSLLAVTVTAQPVGVVPQAVSAPRIAEDTADSADDHTASYVVREGDDLWSLAERFYGSGIQWRKIYKANEPVLGPRPTELVPGTRLILPDLSDADVTQTSDRNDRKAQQPTIDEGTPQKADPQSSAEPTPRSRAASTTTPATTAPHQPTDSASRPDPEASQANGSIPEPRSRATATKPGSNNAIYVVKRGDSLWRIAKNQLGDPYRWPEILRLNRSMIADPDEIDIGWRLHLPTDSSDVGGTRKTPALASQPDARPGNKAQSPGQQSNPDQVSERSAHTSAPGMDSPRAASPKRQTPLRGAEATQGRDQAAPTATDRSDTTHKAESAPEADSQILHRAAPAPNPAAANDSWPAPSLPKPAEPKGRQTSDGGSNTPRRTDSPPDESNLVGARELLGPINNMAAASVIGAISASQIRRAMLRPVGTRNPEVSAAQAHLAAALRRIAASSPPPSGLRIPLGDTDESELVWIDLSQYPSLAISSRDHKDSVSMLTSILFCVCGDVTIDCHLVGPPPEVAATLADWPNPVSIETLPEAQQSWAELAAERSKPRFVNVEARPSVYLCYRPNSPIPETVAGQAWVSIQDQSRGGTSAEVTIVSSRSAELLPQAVFFRPSLIDHLSRHAIQAMLAAAETDVYETAPWWSEQAPDNVVVLPNANVSVAQLHPPPAIPDETAQPKLHLLGAIHLTGARGEAPSRARMQCLEYLAWILEHPGESAIALSNALFVADSTRRSNVSRLRSWLGADDSGTGYLPNAYSQRLRLSNEVGSDWQDLRQLIAGGVNRCQMVTLVAALQLVRGAPLADAAPGQWAWAEHLRTEMTETVRDIGYQLAELALERGDTELAIWAANRALIAAPSDEALLRQKLRGAQLAGDSDSVARLAKQLTNHARRLGVDLDAETVVVIQQAVEGRLRQRAIPSRIP